MSSPQRARSKFAENFSLAWRHLIQAVILIANLVGRPMILGMDLIDGDFVSMELIFLTNSNMSHLHNQDYHVIKINLQNKTSYLMHLIKPNLFVSSDEDMNDKMSQLQCDFSGKILSSDGMEPVGEASLSSCNYLNGFEGLISIQNEHFHLAPVEENRRMKRATKKQQPPQKYKATPSPKPKAGSSTVKANRHDTRRVPAEDLKKAREQTEKDQQTLDDEDEEDDGDSPTSKDNNEQLLDPQNGEEDGTLPSLDQSYAVRRNAARAPAKKTAKVIELAIFTDEAFYRKFQAKEPTGTEAKINQYLLAMVNNMNYLYKQPPLDPKISFRLVHVGIYKKNPNGFKATKDSSKYLDSFCTFQGKKDNNGAMWDHGMMITGLDIFDDGGHPGTIGLAFTSTMCLRYYSCSVVEYTKGFETVYTATHEIGHSLGMNHDGEEMNKKCDPAKYIMAALAGSGQVNWSKCSAANLKNFMISGDPAPKAKDPRSVPRCLTKKGSRTKAINYKNALYPGRKYAAKNQCQMACEGCSPVMSSSSPYNNICWMLHCLNQAGQVVPAHPALEGTGCGNNGKKMCRNGKCQ